MTVAGYVLRAGSIALLSVAAASAVAQTIGPPVLPDAVQFKPVPLLPGVEAAYLASDGSKPENYTLRVRLKADAKIPPHTHPDMRMLIVLSGNVFAGVGDQIDPAKGALMPPGSFLIVPAGAAHWSWANNGDAIYQEFGTGPTATIRMK